MGNAIKPTKKQLRREQILEGLFAAMAEAGSANSSVTEIASAAGIARGALHYYFESKDEIRVALMSRLGERYISRLARAIERGGEDPERALTNVFQFHFGGDHAEQREGPARHLHHRGGLARQSGGAASPTAISPSSV